MPHNSHLVRENPPPSSTTGKAPYAVAEEFLTPKFINTAACFTCMFLHGVPNLASLPAPTAAQAAEDLAELPYSFISPGDLFKCKDLENVECLAP